MKFKKIFDHSKWLLLWRFLRLQAAAHQRKKSTETAQTSEKHRRICGHHHTGMVSQ